MIAYLCAIGIVALIYCLLALGLNLQFGLTRLVNFGVVAFFAVGAYTSGLLALQGVPLVLCFVAAGLLAGLLALPIGLRSHIGKGSVFHVDLPRARARQDASVGTGGLSGVRALVVDNDPVALAALVAVLQGWGVDVVACHDGVAAQRALQAGAFDVWLFDYHLDDGDDGVALHARLVAGHGEHPCLLLSADQTGAVRIAAQEAGLPLLLKPLRPLALKSMLDRILAARGARIAQA